MMVWNKNFVCEKKAIKKQYLCHQKQNDVFVALVRLMSTFFTNEKVFYSFSKYLLQSP